MTTKTRKPRLHVYRVTMNDGYWYEVFAASVPEARVIVRRLHYDDSLTPKQFKQVVKSIEELHTSGAVAGQWLSNAYEEE